MTIAAHRLTALCLAGLAAGVQAQGSAPGHEALYAVGALGVTEYGFDCYIFSCRGGRASAGRVALGYRFGGWSVEAGAVSSGRASTSSSVASRPGETLRLQSAGISLAAYGRWSPSVESVARIGFASVRHQRTGEQDNTLSSATLGLGVLVDIQPRMAVELAWDYASAEGKDSGTASANAFTVGLRVHF